MTQDDIRRMIDNPGIWMLVDMDHPGAEVPICSINGKLYSMKLDRELNPEGFFITSRIAGGPLRA